MTSLNNKPTESHSEDSLVLEFANTHPDLERALDELERYVLGRVPAVAGTARLVLEEMGTNILKYGYDDANPHTIIARFHVGPPSGLAIEDDGHPFDPLQDAPLPGTADPIHERPIGGLGIHMVRNMTAAQSYQRQNGRNRFSVTFLDEG